MHIVESLIVIIDKCFGAFVFLLTVWLILSKAVRNLVDRYLFRRQERLEAIIREAVFHDPRHWEALREERLGDRRVLWILFSQVAVNFSGEITQRMAKRLEALGYPQDALRRLHSPWWWVRAEAAYHLG